MTSGGGERESRLYKWVAGVVVPILVAAIATGAWQIWFRDGSKSGQPAPGPSTPGPLTAVDAAGAVHAVAFSHDGSRLATGGGNAASLWNRATGERIFDLVGDALVEAVAFSPDGRFLATNLGDLWDVNTGDRVRELACAGWDVAFAPDGKLVAAGGGPKGTVGLCDVATGERIRELALTSTSGVGLAFSPDGTMLATNDYKTVQLWNPATGEQIRTIASAGSYGVAFGKDGKLAISSGELVRLWNAATGEQIHTFTGHTQYVTDVALSPNGHLLATASRDHTVQLWNASTGAHIYTYNGHSNTVWAVTFPDDKSLASASEDHTVRLWDVTSF